MRGYNQTYVNKNFGVVSFCCFILFFFPSITFGLTAAEIFPWALVIGLFYLRRIQVSFLLIVMLLSIFTIIHFVILLDFSIIPQVIRSFAAYLNSLFVFAFFLSLPYDRVVKSISLCRWIFYFLVVLGLFQYAGIIQFIDPIMKFLVPRASALSLSHMNRGVTLLSSEPARAGNALIFLYIVLRTVYIPKGQRMFTDLLMTLYLLLVIQSSMALFLFGTYLLIAYNILIVVPAALILVFFLGMDFESLNGRSINLIRELLQMNNFKDVIWLLVNTSGHRLLSIYTSFNYGIHFPFGGGIGNWVNSSVEALHLSGLDLSEIRYFQVRGDSKAIGIRSSGFMSNLVLDVGVIGTFFVLYYVLSSLRKYIFSSREALVITLIFLLKIFFVGSVGHPVAWITTVLCLRYLYNKHRYIRNGFS